MNGFSGSLKSWVFKLIIANVAIFFLLQLFTRGNQNLILSYFGLIPLLVKKGFIWQFVTYMFLHGGFFHLVFNMYGLLIFGIPIEQEWGSKKFLFYYFFTGVGAGISIFILNSFLGMSMSVTIGASGAVFGILLAFGILFPNVQLLVFFVIPMKAKYFVIIFGGIELYLMITQGSSSNISHIGHLGGLLFGIIFFLVSKRRSIKFKAKGFQAKFSEEISKSKTGKIQDASDNREFLTGILEKAGKSDSSSFTDDEFQRLEYLKIMYGDDEKLCVEDDFVIADDYCNKCQNYEACMLREIYKNL